MGIAGKAVKKRNVLGVLRDVVGLYYAFSKTAFLTQLEFRATYAVRTLGKILNWGGGFAVLAIILNRFNAIGTWTTYEVLFLYAMNMFCFSLGATFAMPFHTLSPRINRGELDMILTKPVNPMFFFMCQNVSAGYTSNYVLGIGIMVLAFLKLDITLSFARMVHFILSVIGGTIIHVACFVACGVPAFWLVKSNSFTDILYSEVSRFVDYPLSIYNGFVQVLLTFVLPYAFINFYPAQVFLGKSDSFFIPVVSYLTPVVAAVLFFLAYQFWKFGLRAYKSTGS